MQTKLFVNNLTTKCSEKELQKMFAQYGDVISTRIPTDRYSGRPRSFGFVEMVTQAAAKTALKYLNKKKHDGKVLHVTFSRPEQRMRKRSIAYSYLC